MYSLNSCKVYSRFIFTIYISCVLLFVFVLTSTATGLPPTLNLEKSTNQNRSDIDYVTLEDEITIQCEFKCTFLFKILQCEVTTQH